MQQPHGFEIPGEPDEVYQLLRNLYGTHEAGACWQKLLNENLLTISLKPTSTDPCVYFRKRDSAMADIYVNDMIYVLNAERSGGKAGWATLLAEIGKLFKVAGNTGKGQFLGVNISHDEKNSVV